MIAWLLIAILAILVFLCISDSLGDINHTRRR